MIRRRYYRRINEGSLNRYEKREIIDGEYLLNNCQEFGATDDIRNLYADLRAMLKNSGKVKTPLIFNKTSGVYITYLIMLLVKLCYSDDFCNPLSAKQQ